MSTQDKEPAALSAPEPFEEWDFEALAPGRGRNPDYNDHRLRARRKLGSLAKAFVGRAGEAGLPLDSRTSIHNPHTFNGNRVERLWAYITRPKKEKARLKKVLGADLAKDLDQAYRNAYLCVALEHDCVEVSLRIHPDAWFDGQNLVKRVKREGTRELLQHLNALGGFQLKLADWRGEWLCGTLQPEALDEYLKYYTPGEHLLSIEQRWPAPAGARHAALGDTVPGSLVDELTRLLPAYRWIAWSEASDYLFG
ncbi:MAG: hypothetical protein R3F49_14165 [Planctomycetota bacterium]